MASFLQFSLFLFLGIIAIGLTAKTQMDVMYEWKYIDYTWLSQKHKKEAVKSGRYDYKSPILFDVDRSPDGRTFVTVIGGKGVPASLNVVSNQKGPGGPLLEPYPDWSWYTQEDCDGITSVYRVAIDKCNRLWVLDSGVIEGEQQCTAKLLVFNLKTNKMTHRMQISDNISQNSETFEGLLTTPVIQTIDDKCDNTEIFMADAVGNGLIVLSSPYMWRLNDSYFVPDSISKLRDSTTYDDFYMFESGLFGMALTPKIGTDSQYLVFRPFESHNLYAAKVNDILKTVKNDHLFEIYNYTNFLPSKSTAQAFSSDGVLFFGLNNQVAIGCWKWQKDMFPQNGEIVAQDLETLQFASGVKVIPPSENQPEEELWVSTNPYQKIGLQAMSYKEVNYRVLKQSVQKLIAGTECENFIDVRTLWNETLSK